MYACVCARACVYVYVWQGKSEMFSEFLAWKLQYETGLEAIKPPPTSGGSKFPVSMNLWEIANVK